MIEPENKDLSVRRQCELLGIARASYYYKPTRDDSEEERIKCFIDEIYTTVIFQAITNRLKQRRFG